MPFPDEKANNQSTNAKKLTAIAMKKTVIHCVTQVKGSRMLTADTRRHTSTFCLADVGQTKDAFASRKHQAAQKDMAVLPSYAKGHDS